MNTMQLIGVLAKGSAPEPVSDAAAVLFVGIILAGVLLAVVIAAVRSSGMPFRRPGSVFCRSQAAAKRRHGSSVISRRA
ncbi:MAG: hypothetical protein H0U03_12405 [Actinobacteria bacterium]|nr:hypothetical protein [Actinomycetota bacterium]